MGGTFSKPEDPPGAKVPSDLKIIHFNTQGFQNKVESINRFVRAHKPDILVVTEHFQKSDRDLERIDGYSIVNSFCRQHSERGGVAIWARQDLPCHPRRDLDRHRLERQFEVVSVGVGLGGDLVVTGAYRPPDTTLSDFHGHLDALLGTIGKDDGVRHVLAGDFNVDNRRHNSTRDVLKNHDLKFHIESGTHSKGAAIDNFITNFKTKKSRVIQSKSSQISDHHPIEIVVSEGNVFKSPVESNFNKIFRKIFRQGSKIETLSDKSPAEEQSWFSKMFSNLFPTKSTPTEEAGPKNVSNKRPRKVNDRKISTTPSSQEVPTKIESRTYYKAIIQDIFSYFQSNTDNSENSESRLKHGTRPNKHVEPEPTFREFIKSNCVFCKVVDISFAILHFFRNRMFEIRKIMFG